MRGRKVQVALTDQEHDELAWRARRAGLALATYARRLLMVRMRRASPAPVPRRAPLEL